ncbi:MAG TPA: hypothetical protein VM049_03940 [Gaiellaceae bacterium]|nr:hypothetical protein [Gaiellaceae bacterium]
MKEESQIEDMRAAIRGDRERAERARQRSPENVQTVFEPEPNEPERQPDAAPGLFARLFGR